MNGAMYPTVMPTPAELRLEVYKRLLPSNNSPDAYINLRLASKLLKNELDCEIVKDVTSYLHQLRTNSEFAGLEFPEPTKMDHFIDSRKLRICITPRTILRRVGGQLVHCLSTLNPHIKSLHVELSYTGPKSQHLGLVQKTFVRLLKPKLKLIFDSYCLREGPFRAGGKHNGCHLLELTLKCLKVCEPPRLEVGRQWIKRRYWKWDKLDEDGYVREEYWRVGS